MEQYTQTIGKNVYTVRGKIGYLVVRKKNSLSVFYCILVWRKLWNYIEWRSILFMLLRISNGDLWGGEKPMIQKVNLKENVNAIDELFLYKRVGTLNNHMLNVLQAQHRTLDFHIHENSDELFYCIEGEFDIEFEDGLTHLREGDFIIIPKGTKHRPICNTLVKCLLIEVEGTLNRENTGGTYTE